MRDKLKIAWWLVTHAAEVWGFGTFAVECDEVLLEMEKHEQRLAEAIDKAVVAHHDKKKRVMN